MGGQHQVLRRQLPGEAAFHEARHVGEKERPARPGIDRQHAGLGIALPCPGIRLRMEHGKVHPIPAPTAPPMTRLASRTQEQRPGEKRLGGGKASSVISVLMGEQHPIKLADPKGAQRRLNLGRKGRSAGVAPGGPRIHQQAMLRRFHQGNAPLPHVEHRETKGPGRQPRGWPEQSHHPKSRAKTHDRGAGSERYKGQEHRKSQGKPCHRREGRSPPEEQR